MYKIAGRNRNKFYQLLLILETEVETCCTSFGVFDEKVIEMYHNHAICEQYHSELKSDMNVERLFSGKFDTKALILKFAIIAFSINRKITVEVMNGNVSPVHHLTIDNILMIAGHFTEHAHQFNPTLGRSNGWRKKFLRLCMAFLRRNWVILRSGGYA